MAKESFFSVKDIIRDRRKLTVFGICLGIAALMWLLISLGRNYNTTLLVPIKYVNFPENKTLVNRVGNSLAVNVSGSGYDLLKYDGRLEDDTLEIDLANLKISVIGGYQQGVLEASDIGKELQTRLNGMLAVNRVLTDSLKFIFDLKVTRSVRIKPVVDFKLPNGYVLLDSVVCSPYEVEVEGALSILDTLKFVKTDTLHLGELSASQEVPAKLSRNAVGSEAVFSQENVKLQLNVDQLTEKTFLLEPKQLNVPDSLHLILFPSAIEVIMQVPLSRFNEITEDEILLYVDFDDWHAESATLPLMLESWPVQAQKVRMKDQQVEVVITNSKE